MLFPYIYVSHPLEKFQEHLDKVIREVWSIATGTFSLDLLEPEFRCIVEATPPGRLHHPISNIHSILAELDPDDSLRDDLVTWHETNNDLQGLCDGSRVSTPITYDTIAQVHQELADALNEFYTSLWDHVIGLAAIRNRYGDIDDHFWHAFRSKNAKDQCPFCGYGILSSETDDFRDSYDHYLPKAKYPFNSVSFQNLAPMCDHCNTKVKKAKDPLLNEVTQTRRKAFAPYSPTEVTISIGIEVNAKEIKEPKESEIEVSITSTDHPEEVETWDEIFRIKKRFTSQCCRPQNTTSWLQMILDELAGFQSDEEVTEAVEKHRRYAEAIPWAHVNFLKSPYIQACYDAGKLRLPAS